MAYCATAQPEPLVRALAARFMGGMEGRFAAEIGAHPSAPFPNPSRRVVIGAAGMPIPAPFPHISRHIIKPQFIGQSGTHPFCLVVVADKRRPGPVSRQVFVTGILPIPRSLIY